MRKHRALCKSYGVTYRAKLTQKPTEQNKSELARLELELDAFNIILLRQKVENEVRHKILFILVILESEIDPLSIRFREGPIASENRTVS